MLSGRVFFSSTAFIFLFLLDFFILKIIPEQGLSKNSDEEILLSKVSIEEDIPACGECSKCKDKTELEEKFTKLLQNKSKNANELVKEISSCFENASQQILVQETYSDKSEDYSIELSGKLSKIKLDTYLQTIKTLESSNNIVVKRLKNNDKGQIIFLELIEKMNL